MPRANISADKVIFDDFAAQAMLKGKTLFALTNEWLGAAAKISAEGGDANEVFKLWRSITVLKQIDTIVLPSDFVDRLVAELYAKDKMGLLREFRELGTELVGMLRIAADDIDGLSDLVRDFTLFTPIKRFEIRKKDSSTIEIIIIGAGKKIETAECSFEFLKAVLNGYGYDILSHELSVGTIRITTTKRRTI